MNLCDRCDRHYLAHEASCPFCAAPKRAFSAFPRLGAAVMAVLTPAVLAACYGAPPDSGDTGGPKDADNDGYTSDLDCDDDNAAVNPSASETTEAECGDGLDNDCDGLADGDDTSCT